MPIEQMTVIVTRQIEEAVNGIQGINRVQSITSRGSAEINLFFDWDTDMGPALDRVNANLARIQPNLPSTLKLNAQRLTFAVFPDHRVQSDVGHDTADEDVGAGYLRIAPTSESPERVCPR